MKRLSAVFLASGLLALHGPACPAAERRAVPLLEAGGGSWSSWVEGSYRKYAGEIRLDTEEGRKQFLADDPADAGARCVADAVAHLKNDEAKKFVGLFLAEDGSRDAMAGALENKPSGVKQARIMDRLDIGSLSVYSVNFGEGRGLLVMPFTAKAEGGACHLVANSLLGKYVKHPGLLGILQLNLRMRLDKAAGADQIKPSTQVSRLQVDLWRGGDSAQGRQPPRADLSLSLLFDSIETRELSLAPGAPAGGKKGAPPPPAKGGRKAAEFGPIEKLLDKARAYKQGAAVTPEDYLQEALGSERARAWPQAVTLCENQAAAPGATEYACEYKEKFLRAKDYFEEVAGWDQARIVASMPGDGYKYYVLAGYANAPAAAEEAGQAAAQKGKPKAKAPAQPQARLRGVQFIAVKGGGADYAIDGAHVLGSPVDVWQSEGVVEALAKKIRLPMTLPAKN